MVQHRLECCFLLNFSRLLLLICEHRLDMQNFLPDLLLLKEFADAIVGHFEVIECCVELFDSLHEREMSIPLE